MSPNAAIEEKSWQPASTEGTTGRSSCHPNKMEVTEFLSRLAELDVRLTPEGDKLRVSAPKSVYTAELRAAIANRKQEILAFLCDIRTIKPVSRSKPIRASSAQERLWFLNQLQPDNPSYNVSRAQRIFGTLNVGALRSAVAAVYLRHGSLRTSFRFEDNRVLQEILSEVPCQLAVVDLDDVSVSDRNQMAERLVENLSRQPFDLNAGPLLVTILLRLGDSDYVFLLVTHHIICDGWSIRMLFNEIWSFYDCFSRRKIPELTKLQIQYADYAEWQRKTLLAEATQIQLEYWKTKLRGELPVLSLPTDHLRPPVKSSRGANASIKIPEQLTGQLRGVGRQSKTTLFSTLMAAFDVLLFRYSGQRHIIVGFPIANRNRTELEDLVGLFVNTLVLRVDMAGDPSFRELLLQVGDSASNAYANQDVPFEKLIEELGVERDMSINPLFQVMFILQNAPRPELKVPGLELSPFNAGINSSKFDLTLALAETPDGLTGSFEYSTDLFESRTIRRMVDHFLTLLNSIVRDPHQPIGQLPMLTDQELHQLLAEWNDTQEDYPRDKCVHHLIEEQVERTPDKVAVVFEDEALTYQELNARSNQLARHLRALGVGPEAPVGICIERSLEMVIGLLGILKAGGAYVPLDPAYPEERIGYMIHDSGIEVLLTRDSRSETSGSGVRQVVHMNRDWSIISSKSAGNLPADIDSKNLAYLIYTSGSTGQPKGVQIPHQALTNLLVSMQKNPGLDTHDVFLAVTTISFDIAGLELYLPLITGATVVLASREEVMDGTLLKGKLETSSPTVMQATPSGWGILLESGWTGNKSLRILSGGEALPRTLADLLMERGKIVYNLFGPTETTIWSTLEQIDSRGSSVPIGRPIANTQIRVLDSGHQLVPAIVHGDVYIGGDGLARGYWHQAHLTAERFQPDRLAQNGGMRLYLTGDRGRHVHDGNIEFLGRSDEQLKIRGQRIELGEVEHTLRQHSSIREAVVRTHEANEPADPVQQKTVNHASPLSLVAYLVTSGAAPTISDLHAFLRIKLSANAIPSFFIFLEKLPLAANGKLDRRSLPEPQDKRQDAEATNAPPRTLMEEILTGIWTTVLDREQVGIHDNFFESGGHSLLAARVCSTLHEAVRIELPVRAIFEAPTIAKLARSEWMLNQDQASQPPPLCPISRDQSILASVGQSELYEAEQESGGLGYFNVPHVYRLSGPLNIPALQQSYNYIVSRQEVLRTSFELVDSQLHQRIHDSGSIPISIVDLAGLRIPVQQKGIDSVLTSGVRYPFDVGRVPLIRIWLIRLTNEEHILLIVAHHIIVDDWSMKILAKEFKLAYGAYAVGRKPSLARLQIQFADFATWQREALRSELMQKQLAWWERRLSQDISPLVFRNGRSGANCPGSTTAQVHFDFGTDLSRRIREFAHRNNATVFTVLLTALYVLIYLKTGQRRIRIATLVANRRFASTDELIGHFINTVILESHIDGSMSVEELLRQTTTDALEVYANQDVPYEAVIQHMENLHRTNRNSTFQVMLIHNIAPVHEHNTRITPPTLAPYFQAPRYLHGVATCHLVFMTRVTPGTLSGIITYRSQTFNKHEVIGLNNQLKAILKHIVEQANIKNSVEAGSWPRSPDMTKRA